MNKIKMTIPIVFVFWIIYSLLNANDSFYTKDPILVLKGNAGEKTGEFGMDINFGVRDFIVDINNDIWIMDWGNLRVQRFNANGEFLDSYPNEKNTYPVELRCEYIETDLKGDLFMGPLTSAELIRINNKGRYIKKIGLPNKCGTMYDFAVTGNSEILVPKSGSEVALNEEGNVIYAIKEIGFIRGKNTSPYSPHLFHFNHIRAERYTIYPGGLKNAIENNTKHQINADIFKYDSDFISSHRILLIDKHHNYLVALSAGKTMAQTQQIGYYSKDGQKLATLEMPRTNINTRIYGMPFALDKNGNFYLMQVFLPEDVNTEGPPRFLDSDEPCLYLWKWKRVE